MRPGDGDAGEGSWDSCSLFGFGLGRWPSGQPARTVVDCLTEKSLRDCVSWGKRLALISIRSDQGTLEPCQNRCSQFFSWVAQPLHSLYPRGWVLERPRHVKAEGAHAMLLDPRLRALLVPGRLWTGVHQQTPQHHTAGWWDTHTHLLCASQVPSHLPTGNFSRLPIATITEITIKTVHKHLGFLSKKDCSRHQCLSHSAVAIWLQGPGIFPMVRLFWNFPAVVRAQI